MAISFASAVAGRRGCQVLIFLYGGSMLLRTRTTQAAGIFDRMLPAPYWIAVGVTVLAVAVCVTLHYESLRLLTDRLPMPRHHQRRRIIILILCLLLLHSAEVWIFGLSYFWLQSFDGFGAFVGIPHLAC